MSSMCQCLLQVRSTERHQGPLGQFHQEQCYKYSAHAERSGKIQPAYMEASGVEIRLDQPENIDQANRENECREGGQCPGIPLDRLRQQNQERNHELEYEQDHAYVLPAVIEPCLVPADLFRKIARPVDQQL